MTAEALGLLYRLDPDERRDTGAALVGSTPRGIAISGDSQRIFVTRFLSGPDEGEVVEVRASDLLVERRIALAKDEGPDLEFTGRGVPNYLISATISPDGRRLWLPSKKDNTDRGRFRDGLPLTFEHTVRSIVSRVDLATNTEVIDERQDLDNRELAIDVELSRLGQFAFIATQGTNTVEIYDAYTSKYLGTIEDVGLAPQSLMLDEVSGRLFVHSFLSRSVLVYDVSDLLDGFSLEPTPLGEIPTVAVEAMPAELLAGKRIFYNAADPRMAKDGYLACATCHLDGGHDGRVWDFTDRGEGLRNTISLLGKGGTAQGHVTGRGTSTRSRTSRATSARPSAGPAS